MLMNDEINIKLSQIYLETARSFIYGNVRSRPLEEIVNDDEFQHYQTTFIFG